MDIFSSIAATNAMQFSPEEVCQMEKVTKVNGKIIYKMDKESFLILMDQKAMQEDGKEVKNMDKEYIHGLIVLNMMENGLKISN